MAYLNELNQATVNEWLDNFNNISNNIFAPFQNDTVMSKQIYEALNNDNQYNIRIYMGLDENNNPKVIALSSYYLELGDYEEEGYTDLIVEDGIWELYSDCIISFSDAKEYIDNWKVNSSDNLFKFGFLIPRPNMVSLFVEENLDQVRLFFGINDAEEIKMMMQKPNAGSGDVVVDFASPCPDRCSKDNRLII